MGDPVKGIRRRGRPVEYDRETVLQRAMETFHAKGFASTSLDDLAAAMEMSRPSIYAAFGDKKSLYHQAFAHFVEQLRAISNEVLFAERDLAGSLEAFYSAALNVYFANDPPRGCFVFCTAPAEAVRHGDIADDMRRLLEEVDRALERRFARAQADGEFPRDRSPRDSARLAQAVLHSLALRSRAGETRRSLNRMVKGAVRQLVVAAGDFSRA